MGAGAGPRTLIMGIVNVTPDSFADGGRFLDPRAAVRHAPALAAEGADLLDVGAESTRPGAPAVSASEERARLVPVLERLLDDPPCPVSVDTSKPEVAEAALALGAHMVNDVTALAGGPGWRRCARRTAPGSRSCTCGERPAPCRPTRGTTTSSARCGPSFETAVAAAEAAGMPPSDLRRSRHRFGKTLGHNLTLLKRLDVFRSIGPAILVGPSRKSFIGALLDDRAAGRPAGRARWRRA